MDTLLESILDLMGPKKGAGKELADYLGVSGNVVTNWKNGSSKSYQRYVKQIAQFYGVTVDKLMGRMEEAENEKKPSLLDREQKELDLAEYLEEQRRFLETQEGLMFNGYPASKEAIDSILHALELGARAAQAVSEDDKRKAAERKKEFMDEFNDEYFGQKGK